MMNNNHKNSGCGFAEELMSYLYDESSADEKAAFETHLQSCSICTDELRAFSGVHFSINDWKAKEFDVLETPVIEIPYSNTSPGKEVSVVSSSWLPVLRGLFSLSPRGWSLAAASMAVLAITVGISLFAFNSRTGSDLASEGNKSPNLAITAPTVEKTPETTNAGNQNNAPDKAAAKPLNEKDAPQTVQAVEPNPKTSRVVKTSNNQRPMQKTENSNTPKNNDVKNNRKNKNNDVPPVIPDEDEDDTLRLAELFEEIDTKE
jgi:hypothetical protein